MLPKNPNNVVYNIHEIDYKNSAYEKYQRDSLYEFAVSSSIRRRPIIFSHHFL